MTQGEKHWVAPIFWRPLAPGELDFEKLWLSVNLAATILGFLWLRWGLPLPECVFARWTGLPCPSCGGTRALKALLNGEWATAFLFNPLLVIGLISSSLFSLYCLAAIARGSHRIRFGKFPKKLVHIIRVGVLLLAALHWIYLIRTLPVGTRTSGETSANLPGRGAMDRDVIRTD